MSMMSTKRKASEPVVASVEEEEEKEEVEDVQQQEDTTAPAATTGDGAATTTTTTTGDAAPTTGDGTATTGDGPPDYPVWWSVENNITIKKSEWGGLLPGKKERKGEFSWDTLAANGRFYRPSSKAKSAVNNIHYIFPPNNLVPNSTDVTEK